MDPLQLPSCPPSVVFLLVSWIYRERTDRQADRPEAETGFLGGKVGKGGGGGVFFPQFLKTNVGPT